MWLAALADGVDVVGGQVVRGVCLVLVVSEAAPPMLGYVVTYGLCSSPLLICCACDLGWGGAVTARVVLPFMTGTADGVRWFNAAREGAPLACSLHHASSGLGAWKMLMRCPING